jgi:uncharacterized FlaG/YvyC family protein
MLKSKRTSKKVYKTKKRLTFDVNGNTVNGYVVRIVDDNSVEVRNQSSSKVLVFLIRLDAIAMSLD